MGCLLGYMFDSARFLWCADCELTLRYHISVATREASRRGMSSSISTVGRRSKCLVSCECTRQKWRCAKIVFSFPEDPFEHNTCLSSYSSCFLLSHAFLHDSCFVCRMSKRWWQAMWLQCSAWTAHLWILSQMAGTGLDCRRGQEELVTLHQMMA